MSYKINWTPKSFKFLEKLPKNIAARILNKVEAIKDEPFHYLEHYEGADFYKLRVGDYRLLIDIDFSNKILNVRVLEHRSKVYIR